MMIKLTGKMFIATSCVYALGRLIQLASYTSVDGSSIIAWPL